MSRALLERIKKLEVSKQTSDDVILIIFKMAAPADQPQPVVIGLKSGDEFWYRNDSETPDQLAQRVKADLMQQEPNKPCFIACEVCLDEQGNQRFLDRD
ncbi:hypothetical protein JX580_04485 [Thiomicrospira microaerophila]|uniref:hypothetical protein n=1 Tax=Thiomicrospira microaerophila TaxID=406020 RepID=UPI00200EED6E|nr:hypothetical protein [Thiomicrospira microaerophila]UQB43145.1 hypothetical protein JX580_04485 [Thiomicrospira microaerophila]